LKHKQRELEQHTPHLLLQSEPTMASANKERALKNEAQIKQNARTVKENATKIR